MTRHVWALPAAVLALVVVAGTAQAAPKLKVTPELERAVSKGLEFLKETQNEDGSWPGQYGRVSGVVGAAMMTFLAHGESPDDPKYGPVIRKAVDYIIKNQQSNGLLSAPGGSAMYSHGFATLALAEVYGVIKDERVGPALKKAVDLLVKTQNRLGGWRYSVGSSSADTTVCGAQMMGLRAAANAGIEVPAKTIKNCVAYYKKCFCPGGGFGYTGPSGPSNARAGIGLLVLALSGEYRSPEVKATADWIFNRLPLSGGTDFYFCYYGSQAMYQAGGKYWDKWNKTMTPLLISTQGGNGSWSGGSGHGGGCVTLNTTFALLSLEVNYNLLPIYQR